MRRQHYQCSDPINVFSQGQKNLTSTNFNGVAKIIFKMDLPIGYLVWLTAECEILQVS